MAIVPSGKRRLMKLQQSYQVTDQDGDATQSEVTDNAQSQQSPAFDFNNLQQDMNKQNISAPVPTAEELQGATQQNINSNVQSPDDVEQKVEDLGSKGNTMRSYIFSVLENLGAAPRMIMDDPDAFFQGTKDLDSGRISGSYYLPSYTTSKQITEQEAEKIAIEIGQKFNLSQKLQPKGRNYMITFQTKDDPAAMQTGSSLDELSKGKGKSNFMSNKAASTSIGMMKDRKNSMFDTLKELGFGEKNG